MYQPPDLLPTAGDGAMPPSVPLSGPPLPPSLQAEQRRWQQLDLYPWLAPRMGLIISTIGIALLFIGFFLPWFGYVLGWQVWFVFLFALFFGEGTAILFVLLFPIVVVGLLVTSFLTWFRIPSVALSGWRLGCGILSVVALLIPLAVLGNGSEGGPMFGYWLSLAGMLLALVGSFWGPWSSRTASNEQRSLGILPTAVSVPPSRSSLPLVQPNASKPLEPVNSFQANAPGGKRQPVMPLALPPTERIHAPFLVPPPARSAAADASPPPVGVSTPKPSFTTKVVLIAVVIVLLVAGGVLAFVLLGSPGGIPQVSGHSEKVTTVAWSPDGTRIASGSWDDTVQVWQATSGQRLVTYNASGVVDTLAWSPDGRQIASAGTNVAIWDAQTGKTLRIDATESVNRVLSLAWSPDGKYLAAAGGDGNVYIWNASTAATVFSYQNWYVDAVAWSPDSTRLASAWSADSQHSDVQIWDVSQENQLLAVHLDYIWSLAWSPNGTLLAVAGKDGVEFLEVNDGSIVGPLLTKPEQVFFSVAWSPDGTRVAAAGFVDVFVWDATSGRRIVDYQHGGVDCVAWSPDGTRIASASSDTSVQVWDASTGKVLLMYGRPRGY